MKRFFLLFALLSVGILAVAQNDSNAKADDFSTVFDRGGQTQIGWFVGIDPGYTQIDGRDAWLGGLSAGMIINHNFTIGLTGRGWVNRSQMYWNDITDTSGAYLEGGYGGLLLEYTLFPKSMVHVTFPVMIGGGGTSWVVDANEWDPEDYEWDDCHKNIQTDGFFVVEPGVRAEVNLLKFMRLNAGVSYRYAAGVQMRNAPDDMLNNFTATVGLKFGKF